MNVDASPDSLLRTTARLLEESAFIFTEADEESPLPPAPVLEAVLPFSGAGRGCLLAAMPAPLGAQLAANLMGVDADDAEASGMGREGLCELMNMVAGWLLREWFGEAALCEIGIPDAALREPAARDPRWKSPTMAGTLVTEEGHRIHLAAVIESGGA